MAKTKISEYSSTANSNTDIASINIDEGCAPSGINNAIRALMAQIHDLYAGSSGDTWPVTAGGTGSGTASGARTNLGLVIGTDVQAYDADLAAIASSGKGAEIASYGTYGVGFKNRIINGAMMIDQRNAGASVTINTLAGGYTVDRWFATGKASAGVFTVQRLSASAPAGFTNYLACTTTTSATPGATDAYVFGQFIEGFNVADLGWGSANAQTVTLSFKVYSSLTGTFGGSVANNAANRCYPFSFSIGSANTWTTVSVTIAGDTAGTWTTDNTAGLKLYFDLGSGSSLRGTAGSWGATFYTGVTGAQSMIATNAATFYITGVQLEKGSTATSFDYRPYGTELQLCQRYLPAISYAGGANPYFGAGMAFGTTSAYYTISFPVTPRVPPTGLTVSSASHFAGFLATTATSNATGVVFGGANNHSAFVQLTGMIGLVGGNASMIYMNNSSALMTFTGCEL